MTVWDNVGKMNNKGFEMEINYQKQINQDFGFSVAYNFSVIKNKMTELNGVDYIGLSVVNFTDVISIKRLLVQR